MVEVGNTLNFSNRLSRGYDNATTPPKSTNWQTGHESLLRLVGSRREAEYITRTRAYLPQSVQKVLEYGHQSHVVFLLQRVSYVIGIV